MTARGPRLLRSFLLAGALSCATGCGHSHGTPAPESVPPTRPPVEQGAETRIPVAASPQGFLKVGAEARLQERLRARGFLGAHASSGKLDADTCAALRAFQKSEGLPPTGLPSYETARHLDLPLDAIFETTRHPKDPSATR